MDVHQDYEITKEDLIKTGLLSEGSGCWRYTSLKTGNVDMVLKILNHPHFRKDPQKYIKNFKSSLSMYPKESDYKEIYEIISDIDKTELLRFRDSRTYWVDVPSDICDGDQSVSKCMAELLNTKNIEEARKSHGKEVLKKAQKGLHKWYSDNASPYSI
jgi:hypothetical protein